VQHALVVTKLELTGEGRRCALGRNFVVLQLLR